jgi:hypothetical protein
MDQVAHFPNGSGGPSPMGQMDTSSEEAVYRPGPLKGGGIGEERGLATENGASTLLRRAKSLPLHRVYGDLTI